jgi:excisionase family DNA binding protein
MPADAKNRGPRTVAEVAAELRLHPITVYRKTASGEIPTIRTGGKGSAVRIPADYQERLAGGEGGEGGHTNG